MLPLDFRHGVQNEARGEREGGHEHECRGEDGGWETRHEAGGEVFGHYRYAGAQADEDVYKRQVVWGLLMIDLGALLGAFRRLPGKGHGCGHHAIQVQISPA